MKYIFQEVLSRIQPKNGFLFDNLSQSLPAISYQPVK